MNVLQLPPFPDEELTMFCRLTCPTNLRLGIVTFVLVAVAGAEISPSDQNLYAGLDDTSP